MNTHLNEDLRRLYLEGSRTMGWIQSNGVRIDEGALARHDAETTERIRLGEEALRQDTFFEKWRRRFGRKTNLKSHAQLAEVLIGDYGYRPESVTPTGKARTDEAALARIELPFVRDYLAVSKLHKLQGTYFQQLKREILDGFLHPFFDLFSAVSGRSGASLPNFQNIPIRNPEIGQIIRSCFVSRWPNGRLVEIDYSGIEVRIGCCLHRDPRLINYVEDPSTDMHRDTALQLFFLAREQVAACKGVRHAAKNQFVFPQFYGSVYFQCAPALWRTAEKLTLDGQPLLDHLARRGIKALGACEPGRDPQPGTFEAHVRDIERDFWENRFPVFAKWRRDAYREYLKKGYFESPVGMRWTGIYNRNDVINYGTQQSAFACLLLALVMLHKWLLRSGKRTLIVGQIHDSMVLDVPEDELQEILDVVIRIITEDVPAAWDWIVVPLTAEVDVCPVGGSWADKKPWTKQNDLWRQAA